MTTDSQTPKPASPYASGVPSLPSGHGAPSMKQLPTAGGAASGIRTVQIADNFEDAHFSKNSDKSGSDSPQPVPDAVPLAALATWPLSAPLTDVADQFSNARLGRQTLFPDLGRELDGTDLTAPQGIAAVQGPAGAAALPVTNRFSLATASTIDAVTPQNSDELQVVSIWPSDGVTVPLGSDIQIEMSDLVHAGFGNITLTDTNGNSIAIPVTSAAVRYDGNYVIIDPPTDLVAGMTYHLTIPAAAFNSISSQPMNMPLSESFTAGPADTTAPVLATSTPTDHETNVTPGSVRLEFSELVIRGTGNISIYKSDGTLVDKVSVADSAALTVTANIVYLKVLSTPLDFNTSYYVVIDPGAITDFSGNAFAGITSPTGLTFTTAATPDDILTNLISYTPSNFQSGVALNAPITLTFDGIVEPGQGNIVLTHNGVDIDIPVTDSSQVSFSGKTVTIHPSGNYVPGTDYTVSIAPGTFADVGNNPFENLIKFDFITLSTAPDTTPPSLTSSIPVDNATATPLFGPFTLQFSEAVKAGSGTIAVHNASDGSVFESFDVTDAVHVRFLGSSVEIDPDKALASATSYYITVGAGAITDSSGNAFAGIASPTALNFTTQTLTDTTPPQIQSTTPDDLSAGADQNNPISIVFNEPVQRGTGNIQIHRASDGAVIETISIDDHNLLFFNGPIVTISHTVPFDPETKYYVTVDPGAILDDSGNPFAGISSPTTFTFQTNITHNIYAPTTIAAGTTLTLEAKDGEIVPVGFRMFDYPPPPVDPTLTIAGTVNVIDDGTIGDVSGIVPEDGGYFANSVITIAQGGTFSVSAPNITAQDNGGYAFGLESEEFTPKFVINGTLNVSSNEYAMGINASSGSVVNNGTVNINGRVYAYGYYSEYSGTAGTFTNTGTFLVTGGQGAEGADLFALTNFNNSGAFTVSSSDGATEGLVFSHLGTTAQIVNSGTMTADVAIEEIEWYHPYGSQPDVITNSGTINGAILLDDGNNTITNTGTIKGDIFIGNGNDLYDGTNGTLNGSLHLGGGTDTVKLGGGTYSVSGGQGKDTFYVNGGTGAIEGGSGSNTVIFSGAKSSYTVTQNGAVTTVSGHGGTTTISNVQEIDFSDTTMDVSGKSGLVINFHFDSSVGSAPAAFKSALQAAASYLESMFTDPVTLDINVGYGEIDGAAIDPGALAESSFNFNTYTYSEILAALQADGTSASDAQALAHLQATNPTSGGTIALTQAEAKALGLSGDFTVTDGSIGFDSSASFDFSPGDGIGAGQDDFFAAAVHEISEVMGRVLGVGILTSDGPGYFPLDLFHYSAPNTPLFVGSTPGYFSIDGGVTDLADFNTDPSGDYGDWAKSVGADSFAAFATTGVVNPVTAADLTALDVIGWDRAPGKAPAVADVNGDGFSDIVWQNTNGQAAIWTVNGFSQTGGAQVGGNPGPSWHLKASADFDGDGKADLLWQNDSGQAAIWTMNGFTQVGGAQVGGNPGPTWHVKAAADFNGDGKADILWQNDNGQVAIWTMDGLNQTGSAIVGGNPGPSWHVVGTGDFNGDGKADILWQNDNGQAAIWLMNGLTQIGGATIGGNPGPTWHVIAAGDFNGDGKADILWQNDSGQAAIWTMDGLTQTGGATVGGNPGPTWHVKGAGDYNGDGKADILWQNDNGQIAIWTMNGFTQLGGAQVGGTPGTAWHAVGGT